MVLILYTARGILGRFGIEPQPLTARVASISWVDLGSSGSGRGNDSKNDRVDGEGQRNKDLHVGYFTDLERCGFSVQIEVGADEMTNNPVNRNGGCNI